jgi:adhesin/invasin
MERWEFGLDVEEDDGPDWFLDPIFPLYRHPTDQWVLFAEPRWQFADGTHLFNIGTGARRLVLDDRWLVGANLFYDHETSQSHYRLGGGLEALSAFAELRSNVYLGLSQRRLVEENAGGNTYEEAVNGYDVEAGMPVPYYSRLKLYGGFLWYNFEQFKNLYGWRIRTEFTPIPFIVVDGRLSNDTKSDVDWGVTVAFRIPLGGAAERTKASARSLLRADPTAFPESDARDQLFRLVERHHEIVVERYRQAGSVTVEVSRRN